LPKGPSDLKPRFQLSDPTNSRYDGTAIVRRRLT
jgi:hypothetical protein